MPTACHHSCFMEGFTEYTLCNLKCFNMDKYIFMINLIFIFRKQQNIISYIENFSEENKNIYIQVDISLTNTNTKVWTDISI